MHTRGIMNLSGLSRRSSPVKEPFFILDILPLLRTRAIMKLAGHRVWGLRQSAISRLLSTTVSAEHFCVCPAQQCHGPPVHCSLFSHLLSLLHLQFHLFSPLTHSLLSPSIFPASPTHASWSWWCWKLQCVTQHNFVLSK